MKGAILYGPLDVRLEDVDVPAVGDGEVLARVKVALTCGTDVKVYRRGGHPRMIRTPSLFGHEWAGEIVEVGKGVEGFQEGDRIVAANSAPCFKCYYCGIGRFSLCENLTFLNGAYAEYIKIPVAIVKTNLYKIPPAVSFEEAAFLEPLACVVHGVEEIEVEKGE
ncbi:MAG TPA: alcohol dehydrogenase, partial [Candidatus Omnitrophica bacterium]|nr:alcohol dehydrogenase [Candidatus Omnitrophota bacterium]